MSSLNLRTPYDAQGRSRSETLKKLVKVKVIRANEQRSERSLFFRPTALTGLFRLRRGMIVQRFDALLMDLSLVGTPKSSGGEKQRPFVHLDRHLSAGWSSVYASSRSHVIVKFAWVPEKDRARLERLLRNEEAAYDKVALLTRWVVCIIGNVADGRSFFSTRDRSWQFSGWRSRRLDS